jgi:hypothetical protein
MSNTTINTATLRNILLNRKAGSDPQTCENVFDALIAGDYAVAMASAHHLQLTTIVDIVYACVIARSDEFVHTLNRIANIDADVSKQFHFACLIGVFKGVVYRNMNDPLSNEQERIFVDYIPIAFTNGGLESDTCCESQLSDTMSRFFESDTEALRITIRRQAGMITEVIVQCNLTWCETDKTFRRQFFEEFTHKFWSQKSIATRINFVRQECNSTTA